MSDGDKKLIHICEKCRHLRRFGKDYGCDLEEEMLYYPTVDKLMFETLGPAEGCPYILEHTIMDDVTRRDMKLCDGCRFFFRVYESDELNNDIDVYRCGLVDNKHYIEYEYTTLEIPENCVRKKEYGVEDD